MNQLVCSHVPYPRIHEYLDLILTRKLNPEINFSAEALDSIIWEELAAIAEALHGAGLVTTIHGPFYDLNPAAFDPLALAVVRKRYDQTFRAAKLLKPRVIVFHPGYDKLHYLDSAEVWLKQSIAFWQEMLPKAEEIDCIMAIENIFEEEPATLRALLESVDSPRLRHCFDTGHFNMFAKVSLEEWFAELGPYMAESHIHDNHGRSDEHLPPGEGIIDFDKFFQLIRQYAPDAVWTLEAHSIERLKRAHNAIATITGEPSPF